ncbi:hypothetical protein N200_01260 [Helicobacter pylori UM065]|nr:hypothetical protein N200_01260 [Helicobacter pylori UM065]
MPTPFSLTPITKPSFSVLAIIYCNLYPNSAKSSVL